MVINGRVEEILKARSSQNNQHSFGPFEFYNFYREFSTIQIERNSNGIFPKNFTFLQTEFYQFYYKVP